MADHGAMGAGSGDSPASVPSLAGDDEDDSGGSYRTPGSDNGGSRVIG